MKDFLSFIVFHCLYRAPRVVSWERVPGGRYHTDDYLVKLSFSPRLPFRALLMRGRTKEFIGAIDWMTYPECEKVDSETENCLNVMRREREKEAMRRDTRARVEARVACARGGSRS